MKDSIGDRMKDNYENRFRLSLPRRTYTIIRVDGKAFHTYTRGMKRPFDDEFMEDMDKAAAEMCKNIMGAKFAFVQSDEISILVTDFDGIDTQSWFDSNLQNMCSVSASMATASFNKHRIIRLCANGGEVEYFKFAEFDSRVFQISQKDEVENYFVWRQQDTSRNSIQSVAQSLYSAKQLHGKNTSDLQEMIHQKGTNWNDFAPKYKRGRVIAKEEYEKDGATRTRWAMREPPIFTQDREFLSNLIPSNS